RCVSHCVRRGGFGVIGERWGVGRERAAQRQRSKSASFADGFAGDSPPIYRGMRGVDRDRSGGGSRPSDALRCARSRAQRREKQKWLPEKKIFVDFERRMRVGWKMLRHWSPWRAARPGMVERDCFSGGADTPVCRLR